MWQRAAPTALQQASSGISRIVGVEPRGAYSPEAELESSKSRLLESSRLSDPRLRPQIEVL